MGDRRKATHDRQRPAHTKTAARRRSPGGVGEWLRLIRRAGRATTFYRLIERFGRAGAALRTPARIARRGGKPPAVRSRAEAEAEMERSPPSA